MGQRGNVSGNMEQQQIVQAVLDFIDRHGDSRFSDVAGPYDDKQQSMVRDRATSWWEGTGEMVCSIFFTSVGMREAVTGFDFNRALKCLEQAGLLTYGSDGKHRAQSAFIRATCVCMS